MPRHRAIYEALLADIQSGVYKPGDRLPSEAALCERFDASRITVAKAFQSLQRDNLVTRRPGSGSYVERPPQQDSRQFGLLIPEFGTTEIFEPICQGIMRSPLAHSHSLSWGHSTSSGIGTEKGAEELCRQYIAQGVAGVFFAPIEYADGRHQTNRRIAALFERAGIPVVLLDRCFERYPDRSNFDLVGIDNHRAGFTLTRHMIEAGSRRIVFAMRQHSAPTVQARSTGYGEAIFRLLDGQLGRFITGDFEDPTFVQQMLEQERPDGIVCANDVTAAKLMRTLIALGVRIPEDIRMAGIDDVPYARFLPTPLTTIRQDCAAIGAAAMSAMLDRLRAPAQPARDIRISFEIVIRESTVGKAKATVPSEE
jgi:DNA-binding LacI/PurR family transcriptional regulator